MDIGIVTIAYNGYGQFLRQWCEHVAALTVKPTRVTIALGTHHGFTPYQKSMCTALIPNLNIVQIRSTCMGALRNAAIEATESEWIMYLSADDIILPHAIDEYEKYEQEADYIAIRWIVRGLGLPDQEKRSALPEEIAAGLRPRFIIGHSPFRRSFWKLNKYEEHEYPNAPFVAAIVENGGRFVNTERPCTVYLRRPDSHSKGTWGLRRRGEKRKAVAIRDNMEQRIAAYYGKKL